jgi:hypothetical protein
MDQVAENDIGIDGCHNPFTPAIMNFDMPTNFKFSVQIDPYDGTTDPKTMWRSSNRLWSFRRLKNPLYVGLFP